MTIKDVAREAGVNISTVSRALAGGYGVRRATREKILRIAELLNYRPNSIARGLVTGHSQTIGLLISDIRNPYFAEIARGVEDAAAAAGFEVFLCNSDLDCDKQMRYVHSLQTKHVDGIIMNTISNLSTVQRTELVNTGVPVVLLNRPPGHDPLFSTVMGDNYQGGFLAGQHLIALGHRSIAHISGPRDHGNLSQRAKGFLEGCAAAGRSLTPLVVYGEHTFSGGYELTKKVMARCPSATALFAANDIMAFGAIRALMDMGLKTPSDVSVVGFDDIEMASVITPALTTIRQPIREIGHAAVEVLLRRSRVPEQRTFGVTLIERQSCRALVEPSTLATAAAASPEQRSLRSV